MSEIIQLISGPRNISTALMYAFGNREDTAIVDEPFYACYLSLFGVDYHPGKQEIMDSMSSDPQQVIDGVLKIKRKEMAKAATICGMMLKFVDTKAVIASPKPRQ